MTLLYPRVPQVKALVLDEAAPPSLLDSVVLPKSIEFPAVEIVIYCIN